MMRGIWRFKKVVQLFCIGLLALGLASNALATPGVMPTTTDPNVYGSDVYFVYPEATPGSVIEDEVRIVNTSTKTETYQVDAYDALLGDDGGFSFVASPAENVDVGTWVKLEKNRVTVEPKKEVRVKMTVTVPKDAEPGDHAGAIGAINVSDLDRASSTSTSGSGVRMVTRIGCRIYATVPGDIKVDLKIKRITHKYDHGRLTFSVLFQNDGNIRVQPKGDVSLRGVLSDYGTMNDTVFASVFPKRSADSSTQWKDKVPAFGRYVATFDLNYKDNRILFNQNSPTDYNLKYSYVFWLIPWAQIIWTLFGVIALLLLVLLWRWFGVAQRKRIRSDVHEVKAGESIQQIATMYGVDVRALIRFNALRWPFEMNPGEYLLIPHYDQPRSSLWYGLKTGASEMLGGLWSKILVVKVFKKQPKVSQPVLVASSSSPSKTDKPVKTEMSLELEKLIVDEGDTIYDVASFAGTSWDMIASINHLKPPYRLIPGEEILAPRKVELPIEEVTVIVEKEEIIVAPKKTVAKASVAKKATTEKIVRLKSKRQTKRSAVAKRTIKKKSSK